MATADAPNTRLSRILTPGFTKDLGEISIEDLRARRVEAEQEETELSYIRRLLHARIDILQAELRRRAGHGEDVIANLAWILSDSERPGGFSGRFVEAQAPRSSGSHTIPERAAVADAALSDLSSLDDAEVRRILDSLSRYEREISTSRGQLHRVLDRLTAELTRRYREGTARVDDLLAAHARPV